MRHIRMQKRPNQNTDQPIYVGLDLNNTNFTNLFYGNNVLWYQSLTDGSVMIRPYFRYQPHDISIKEKNTTSSIRVYPNPTSGIVHIDAPEYQNFEIMDMNGRRILSGKLENNIDLDLSILIPGAYILILQNNAHLSTHKIILY